MQTESIDIQTLSKKAQKEMARDQLLDDIDILLEPYKNKDIGLRIIAEQTGINEKTFHRIIQKLTVPHLSTVERFYHYFFKRVDQSRLTEAHKRLVDLLGAAVDNQLNCVNEALGKRLEEDSVLREIFLYSRTGLITKEFVKNEFGNYGIKIIDELLSNNVLRETDKGVYAAGTSSIPKSTKAMKKIVQQLNEDNLDTDDLMELGNNKIVYAVEGIDDESKQQLLKLMDEYNEKILNFMLRDAKLGSNRMFVTSTCDSLKKEVFKNNETRILQ